MFDRSYTHQVVAQVSIALLVLALLAAGCAGANIVEVNEDDDGTQVQLNTGQKLVVTLGSNPTTGYSWDVDSLSETVLQPIGESEYQSESNLVGAGGTQTMRFEAVGAGECTLKLIYHRPWEGGVEPIQTFTLQISVQ